MALGGCVSSRSYSEFLEERRERLLAEYPPGETTRADVQARFGVKPQFLEMRPAADWSASTNRMVQEMAMRSEERTGEKVYRCELYTGPLGFSGGLYSCWFYYDERDRVVDADWPYHSD
jgi:hypothetical protein